MQHERYISFHFHTEDSNGVLKSVTYQLKSMTLLLKSSTLHKTMKMQNTKFSNSFLLSYSNRRPVFWHPDYSVHQASRTIKDPFFHFDTHALALESKSSTQTSKRNELEGLQLSVKKCSKMCCRKSASKVVYVELPPK